MMFRVLFLFFIYTTFIFSNTIEFKEEKYIDALQSSFYKNGMLKITDSTLEIKYPKKHKSFIFTQNNIIKTDNDKEEILSYEDNLELTIFSKIIESIYRNQADKINDYFKIKKEDTLTILIPNDYISNVIDKIEYEKNNNKLKFLKIYFLNKDWINIIETN